MFDRDQHSRKLCKEFEADMDGKGRQRRISHATNQVPGWGGDLTRMLVFLREEGGG